MGACSSKPKTTEFEGPTEPLKHTQDVPADRSIDVADANRIPQQNEPIKEEAGTADADAKAVQEVRGLFASKDEEPSEKGLRSTREGVSQIVKADAGVLGGGETVNNAVEKLKVDTEAAQTPDAAVGVAPAEEVSDTAITADDGVGIDQYKRFEDKGVVLDEAAGARARGMGDTYTDKGVAANEERVQESGVGTTQDENSGNLQDVNKSPGAESPIIGLVQAADPSHVDDVSDNVGLGAVETPAHVDSVVSESPAGLERDVCEGPKTREDGIPPTQEAANLSPGPSQETPDVNKESLNANSKGSPLIVSAADDEGGQDSGADDIRVDEAPLASADAQVEDFPKPETVQDPHNDTDERTYQPQEQSALEEISKESYAELRENEINAEVASESHAEASENDANAGLVHVPDPEVIKIVGSGDDQTFTEPKAETTLVEAVEEQDEGIVGEPNASDVQAQTLATKEPAEDAKQVAKLDEAVVEPCAETERADKVDDLRVEEAATNKETVERAEAGFHKFSVEQVKNDMGENDIAFKDASDVALKVESGTIESVPTSNT